MEADGEDDGNAAKAKGTQPTTAGEEDEADDEENKATNTKDGAEHNEGTGG